jgi:hypothetical protein
MAREGSGERAPHAPLRAKLSPKTHMFSYVVLQGSVRREQLSDLEESVWYIQKNVQCGILGGRGLPCFGATILAVVTIFAFDVGPTVSISSAI